MQQHKFARRSCDRNHPSRFCAGLGWRWGSSCVSPEHCALCCAFPWVSQDGPGSSQDVDRVIQAKKKKKKFPVYCISLVKLIQTRWVKTFFFSCNSTGTTKYYLCSVWWALKGRVKRFGMKSFVSCAEGSRFGAHRCVCEQGVTAQPWTGCLCRAQAWECYRNV